jgi:hypothetical protein
MAGLNSAWLQRDKAAQVAGGLAGLAAALAIGGWAFPPLLDAVGIPFVVVLFVIMLSGMVLLAYPKLGQPRRSRKGFWSRPLPPDPFRFLNFLNHGRTWTILAILAFALAGFVAAANGLGSTGGYSQNPAWTISKCKWSIGTNHGATNICVSHARWLATGQGFDQGFLGFLAVFFSIEAAIFLGQTVGAEVRGSRT